MYDSPQFDRCQHRCSEGFQLRANKGILKVARECGVGTGTVQRVKAEMESPFDVAAAAA